LIFKPPLFVLKRKVMKSLKNQYQRYLVYKKATQLYDGGRSWAGLCHVLLHTCESLGYHWEGFYMARVEQMIEELPELKTQKPEHVLDEGWWWPKDDTITRKVVLQKCVENSLL